LQQVRTTPCLLGTECRTLVPRHPTFWTSNCFMGWNIL
jgi:hypothetical protein